jgi:hypothetical protein
MNEQSITNDELRKIILKQRVHYGDALFKLEIMLREAKLTAFADVARSLRANYGLVDKDIQPINHNLNVSDLCSEIERVLKANNRWMAGREMRPYINGNFTNGVWIVAVRKLRKDNLIETQGTHSTTTYRWNGRT